MFTWRLQIPLIYCELKFTKNWETFVKSYLHLFTDGALVVQVPISLIMISQHAITVSATVIYQ